MKICFTGDLFLGGDLHQKSTMHVVKSSTFLMADKRVVNLEQPISDDSFVEEKCTLHTGSYAIGQLKELKIDAVNLAHNHIQDKGLSGIKETIFHLRNGNIKTFGAGENIAQSKEPVWITDDIAILGYCEYGKPYLKQITIANEENPGINPLRYENIIEDLNNLLDNKKAILYFHWGREHVWLPPYEDIELSKILLEHDKVVSIIGMHAHRPQGYIEHNGKRAYMCLGNFIFPNFYIAPPTQLTYPEVDNPKCDLTRQYHGVTKLTYKKWRFVNRVSLLLEFDTESLEIHHKFIIQDDNNPIISDLAGYKLKLFSIFLNLLHHSYKLPRWIYVPLEKLHTKITYFFWKGQILLFMSRQMGVKSVLQKLYIKVLKK